MRVAIIGPDLYDQSKGTFHVHSAECRDGKNARKYPLVYRHEQEAASAEDVVKDVYQDQIYSDHGIEEGTPEEDAIVAEYLHDFYFHNCTKGL